MTRCPRCQRRLPPSGECAEHGKPTSIGEAQSIEEVPEIKPPAGWQLGPMIAIGGSAVVYELSGSAPSVLKWARWRARDLRARFAIEANVLRAVGPPTTPQLYADGHAEAWPYLVMEYLRGDTLATWMARTGARGSLGEVVALLVRIAAAVGKLHDAGHVHRDLKPENISIGARSVRLLDFGLAKELGAPPSELTQATVVGTMHYLAPEQIRMNAVADHRADIYAFGVIAFEMLTGGPPFVGERRAIEYQHQVSRAPAVRDSRAIPHLLDELVAACLAKQPDARPPSMQAVQQTLSRALGEPGTFRGLGGVAQAPAATPITPGRETEVALAWIVGGDPIAVTRAIAAVNGVVARQRGDGILVAFTATLRDPPLAIALEVCQSLCRERCRVVLHATTALVRRTPSGKPMVYGRELEDTAAWTPRVPFTGVLLTATAAARAGDTDRASEALGFYRVRDARVGDTTDIDRPSPFVGREQLVEHAAAALARPSLVCLSGEAGAGKSRVLTAIADRIQRGGREVIRVRPRRRFPGDIADDGAVLGPLGGGEPRQALHAAAMRGVVLAIDDADQLSRHLRTELDGARALTRIVTSTRPLFESNLDERRLALSIPRMTPADADALLRALLRPARLIPDVLVERIVLRATGSPRVLTALARDMRSRGALRRHAGSDEWYVAVDELDTLLAPPSAAWFAARALDDLPRELSPVLRFATALGPVFCADEVAHVTGLLDAPQLLGYLAREGLVTERDGWYEFADHTLAEAIYLHGLDERVLVHSRALAYWLGRRAAVQHWIPRVAFHAFGATRYDLALATSLALAESARDRDEHDEAWRLVARCRLALDEGLPRDVRVAVEELDAIRPPQS